MKEFSPWAIWFKGYLESSPKECLFIFNGFYFRRKPSRAENYLRRPSPDFSVSLPFQRFFLRCLRLFRCAFCCRPVRCLIITFNAITSSAMSVSYLTRTFSACFLRFKKKMHSSRNKPIFHCESHRQARKDSTSPSPRSPSGKNSRKTCMNKHRQRSSSVEQNRSIIFSVASAGFARSSASFFSGLFRADSGRADAAHATHSV